MEKCDTELLAQFCITQRNAFDANDWHLRFDADGAALALAAKYLSMTSWYGHEDELEQIVARTGAPAENSVGLYRESQVAAFDLPYFSAKVRGGIASAALQAE